MEQKQRFFIYGRKEMGVLVLLGLLVAVFAFTLGVHLGKRVIPKSASAPVADASTLPTLPDNVPNQQELSEEAKNTGQRADEALGQALHEEVLKTGIKLDQGKPMELPKELAKEKAREEKAPEPRPARSSVAAPIGKYTLQIGSFPSLREAQQSVQSLPEHGLKPYIRSAEIKGKGKWFRVFAGSYATRLEAETAGEQLKAERTINSFVISKLTD